jgi:hypothetical protein
LSRLSRLSTRAYGRLGPERQYAVDLLQFGRPDAAARGRAKTILGWRRTREETAAYAQELLDSGLVPAAVADRLKVADDYLRRVLDCPKPARNPSIHAGSKRTNRQRQGDPSSMSPRGDLDGRRAPTASSAQPTIDHPRETPAP